MLTVDDRLRAAATEVQEYVAGLSVPGLEPHVGTEPTRMPTPTVRRGFVVLVAAAVVLLMAIGGVALWSFTGEEVPVATTLPPITTTAPPPTTPAPVDSWQRVGAEVVEPARAILDMIYTPSGFLAIGFDTSAGDTAEGLVFSSPDGVTWSRLAEDDPALTDGTVIIYSLTEGGPGLVAGGISCQDAIKPCTVRPTVWTSVDGASWTRSDADPDVFTESGAILDVISIDSGVVAVGNTDEIGPDGTPGARPAAWFSEDGIEWSRVFDGELVSSPAVGVAGPHAIDATPDGLLVGVGSAENQAGDAVAAVWVSPDGQSWERVAAESFAPGTLINDFVWGSNGFIAVGAVNGGHSAIWQSPDGYTWSRVDISSEPFDDSRDLNTIAALDDGYVTGGPGWDAQGGPVTLWTSPDGTTWNRVQTMPVGNAHAIVVTDTGIAVGGTASDHAAVWVGPVFDPYAPPLDPKPTTTTAAVLEEPAVPGPELEWERIESEALDPGLIWAVTSSDNVIVAVGEVQYFVDVDQAFGETPNGVVWVSADGVEWTRIDDPGIFGGDGAQIIWDVVAAPSGFMASGQDGANSVLWFSVNGYTWQRVFDDDLGTPGDIEDLAVASGGPGWIAAAIEGVPAGSPTGIYLTSVDGIDWVTVSDPAEAAAFDAELRPLGDEWRSPFAFPASASERMPVTHAPGGGDGVWDYAWNGDQVMAAVRNHVPEIWISPDAGVTWYLVDQDERAFDGAYAETQVLGVEYFNEKWLVVGFDSEAAAVWQGTWPEQQGN